MNALVKALVGVITLVLLVGSSVSVAFAASDSTTNVTFTEFGLPSGTNWTVTFNGSPQSSTTNTITFTGETQTNCLSWSTASTISTGLDVQYATSQTGGCMNTSGTVPVQNTQSVVYTEQVQVTMAVSPSGTGSVSLGTAFYNAGTPIPISAVPNVGQTFSKWTASSGITVASSTTASTTFTATSPGTVTADFKASSFTVTFTEFGLPASTQWSVTFNGNQAFSTSTSLTFTKIPAGGYSWSAATIPGGSGVQFSPSPASGFMSVPGQTAQELVFAKQDQVTFGVNPSGSGSTSPSGSSFFNDASKIVVTAFGNAATIFSSWSATGSITFASSTSASTIATISGTGTITANFNPGTPCTTCTVTFTESGLPSGTGWGVDFNGQVHTSTTTTITISNVPAGSYGYTPTASIAGGSGTIYSTPSCCFSMSVGSSQTTQAILYTEQFLVKFSVSPSGSGSTNPSSPEYVNAGSTITMFASPSTGFAFSAWKGAKNAITVSNGKSQSAAATVTGPGTITATFKQVTSTVTFTEQGLPSGTIWSVTLGGVSYFSTTGSPSTVTINNVAQGSECWSLSSTQTPIFGGTGVQYAAVNTNACMNVPQQTTQLILFVQQVSVSFIVSPAGSGTISPTGTMYITVGTVVALQAFATAGFAFSSWASTGSIVIANTASPATAATINGAGTITGTF
ncbi:MAG TPA: hypothetical protein VLY21_06815 [Nitrososphaerales archaeon]|nr:hypothetical protein [Nitrososphaerales archaeon]